MSEKKFNMLVTLKKVLQKAQKEHYAVGAFNVNNLEILQGIIRAAEKMHSPVIFQTSEGAIQYAGLEYLFGLMQIASKVKIPVVIHLDHGKNIELIKKCIKIGYSSVMFDGSSLPLSENVALSQEIVRLASKYGASVEAEIGVLRGIEDFIQVPKQRAYLTDPKDAEEFVHLTKCDALAVAIGTSHGAYKFKGESKLDFTRLHEIQKRVKIPLVLHGASGIPHNIVSYAQKHCKTLHSCARLEGAHGVSNIAIRNAIRMGICKINIDTDLRIAFTGGVLNTLFENKKVFDPRIYLGKGQELVQEVVEEKMRLFGSAGKA